MKKFLLVFLTISTSFYGLAQMQNSPNSFSETQIAPNWGAQTKAAGDSCGAYFNNYIGLQKTTNLFTEYMRKGDVINDFYYNGRAQRYTVSQPVDVSGVEFYAYHTSGTQDSIMVITSLHSYNSVTDSLGPEITRDTVYVLHTAFTAILPNISVKSFFDAPITMSSDFIIAMHSVEDEELVIITNDYNINEGNNENFSYALYQNPAYPSFDGWYSVLNELGYDYDYLMSPLVKYDLHNNFLIIDDTICPAVVSAGCVDYTQVGNFANHIYNSQSATPTTHIVWLWGDGFQNTDIITACHTYATAGTKNINLRDTLFRHDITSPYCIVNVTQPIVVLGPPVPSFTFLQSGLTADFTNTSTNADSVWWDFGDGTLGSSLDSPSHSYSTLGTFDVWLYSYNECFVDSTMLQVTTDDVGILGKENQLTIFPNPSNSVVVISGLTPDSKLEIINLLGEKIITVSVKSNQESIDVSDLAAGTYFIKISNSKGQVTKKLAVKH